MLTRLTYVVYLYTNYNVCREYQRINGFDFFSSSHIVFRIVIGIVPVYFLVQENFNEEWGVIYTLYTYY